MAEVEFGYVYDFGAGEEFMARRGEGATLNGEPISAEPPPSDRPLELVGFEGAKPALAGPVVEALGDDVYRLRVVGSLAITISYVAAARLDGSDFGTRPRHAVHPCGRGGFNDFGSVLHGGLALPFEFFRCPN